ncbi:MAG TPA: hypothetical protein VKT73_15080 [Xanthobacteraceae bacterium]|nr:hypothetical protein [Xanthobacteraceae bacterium]
MGKSSPPPPPDYTPIAQASEASADKAYQLGEDQLAWAKQQYAENKDVTDQVVGSFLQTQDLNDQSAQADRARYQTEFQPLEDQLVQDAQSYATPQRKDLERGRAQAAVSQSFDTQRQNSQRDLEAFGINPGATRFGALDIATRAQQAAATAAAGNQSDQMVDATGRAIRSEAINVGRGYPGQIAGQYGTALTGGTSAVNAGLATTASGAQTMGTSPQYMALGNNALGVWGNTLNMGYQNQLSAFNAQQQASSGFGSALGLAAGLMFAKEGGAVPDPKRPFSDHHFYVIPRVNKQGKQLSHEEAMTHFFHTGEHHGVFNSPEEAQQHFAGGGVPLDQTQGGGVPAGASPSGGQAIDDVAARLTAGEFVVPKDVARWKGEEFFQKLISQSRNAKQKAVARPTFGPAIPMGGAPQPRPGAAPAPQQAPRAALPVR